MVWVRHPSIFSRHKQLPLLSYESTHTLKMNNLIKPVVYRKGGEFMYGCFGGYTRWAVVFLIIFVLFFLLVPHGYGGGVVAAGGYGGGVIAGGGYGY
jgi:hypothetical protein